VVARSRGQSSRMAIDGLGEGAVRRALLRQPAAAERAAGRGSGRAPSPYFLVRVRRVPRTARASRATIFLINRSTSSAVLVIRLAIDSRIQARKRRVSREQEKKKKGVQARGGETTDSRAPIPATRLRAPQRRYCGAGAAHRLPRGAGAPIRPPVSRPRERLEKPVRQQRERASLLSPRLPRLPARSPRA
jgi:hypothetical protein